MQEYDYYLIIQIMVNICMISDFFFPNIGGVESHIYAISYCLRQMGHKVIIVSNARKEHNLVGVRYFANGIKVYYIPYKKIPIGIVMPGVTGSYTVLLRNILYRENIDIMHGHQTTSTLNISSMIVTKMLKIPYVFTQHSLYDFNHFGTIELNKLYSWLCRNILTKVICVSNTVRENFILQTDADVSITAVIPNAVDASFFCPRNPKYPKNPGEIRVIVLTRMTFRKGMDLLLEILPVICKKYANVKFLLCGDGPKKPIIEELLKEYDIEDRVTFEGFVNFEEVPYILSSGDIFLNTSISEAFCIAIIEAISCGVYVISTNVGGINEILPNDMLMLCKFDKDDMLKKFDEVIEKKLYVIDKIEFNTIIKTAYNWHRVAKEIFHLYTESIDEYSYKPFSKFVLNIFAFNFDVLLAFTLVTLNYLILLIASFIQPKSSIEYATDLPFETN